MFFSEEKTVPIWQAMGVVSYKGRVAKSCTLQLLETSTLSQRIFSVYYKFLNQHCASSSKNRFFLKTKSSAFLGFRQKLNDKNEILTFSIYTSGQSHLNQFSFCQFRNGLAELCLALETCKNLARRSGWRGSERNRIKIEHERLNL